jgi:hypothetical protein
MRTPYNNVLRASNSAVKGESASALWVFQSAYHTKQYQDPLGKRVFLISIPIIPWHCHSRKLVIEKPIYVVLLGSAM